MNIELLEKIAEVIVQKPEEFDMNYFDGFRMPNGTVSGFSDGQKCGTTHCIGGWAAALCPDERDKEYADILGLTEEESDRLFYVDGLDSGGWPKQFCGVAVAWQPTAEQAAARIRHFIATDGAE